MAYFLKKSKYKRGIYLQIYSSYRDSEHPTPRHSCEKTLGYVSDLQEKGIADPISFYQKEVDIMNGKRNEEFKNRREKQIGSHSPMRYLGYFPADAILRKLEVRQYIDMFQYDRDYKFSIYECMRDLIHARLVRPASKRKTIEEVIPSLWDHGEYSYDQMLACLDLLGSEYEKVVEIFTRQLNETYILNTSKTYFDCTNYYFEIDREDDWRRKGPSKERRTDPILGMGLLLDANCLPISMRLYPGNQSEKPVYREVIRELKRQQNITGKTIRVADKGLNCAQNIYDALSQGDGYIFSKSVKTLNKAEREWALNTDGFIQSNDSDKDSYWMKSCVDEYTYEFKEASGRKKKFKVKEKRIVTYSPKLERKHREEINKMVAKAESCRLCEAKKSEYGESSKYLTFSSADENGDPAGKAVVQLDQKKIDKDLDCAGFNMIVTSEVTMEDREIYDTYHELWRIEESFRTLKTQLTARPVFLKNIDRIKGHFLICYLCVVLERILQFKVLKNQFGSEEVYEFIRGFNIVPDTSASYINLSKTSGVEIFLRDNYNLPLTNYFLRKRDIKKITERAL